MPVCVIARSLVLPAVAILLCWYSGVSWAFVAEVTVLTRRAAAQVPASLSPGEKQQLFQRFQDAQGAVGPATATPIAPEPAPASRVPSTIIQLTPLPRPARTRPSYAPEPTPTFAEPTLVRPPVPSATALRVVIHVPAGFAAEMLAARMLANFDPRPGSVEIRRVAATPSQPSIRYFHSGDETAARDVAARLSGTGLAWTLRDFSTFRPLPSRGTIEVWVPERA